MSKTKRYHGDHIGGCWGKQRFDTFEQADKAAKIPNSGFMGAYKCKYCGKFHFGHPRQKK